VDEVNYPGVYAVRMDYPPKGAAGRGQFLVTYHATERQPSMVHPYWTITFLTIQDREA
jgi:hypothetical protein